MQQSLNLFFFLFMSQAAQQEPELQKVCFDNYVGIETVLNSSQCTLKVMTEEEKIHCKSLLECKIPAELYPDIKVCLDIDLGAGGGTVTDEQKASFLKMEKESCDKVSEMRMKCSYEAGQMQGRPTGADPNTTLEDCLLKTRPLPKATGVTP